MKYCVFGDFIYWYSATYGPILMKLGMVVKSHRIHVFTVFRKVLSFCLDFIGIWVYFGHAPSLNDSVTSKESTKFNIFLIIINLEHPENCTAVV